MIKKTEPYAHVCVENLMEKNEENCAANRAKNNTFDEGNFIVREFFCVIAALFNSLDWLSKLIVRCGWESGFKSIKMSDPRAGEGVAFVRVVF